MSERFYSQQKVTGDRVTLDGPEAHHLLHVMRAAAGDRITLFDDSGAEFEAVVAKLGRAEAVVDVVEREVNCELPFSLVAGVALPKGDRQKWLVEKLTELGVSTLVPLVTDRSVAQPASGALEKLRRAVIEASKQCGRNRLMQIAEPQTWQELAKTVTAPRRLLAHPGGAALRQIDLTPPQSTMLAIGPEGGLADAEVALAVAAGWQMVDLGPRILRVETAAIALAAAIALR